MPARSGNVAGGWTAGDSGKGAARSAVAPMLGKAFNAHSVGASSSRNLRTITTLPTLYPGAHNGEYRSACQPLLLLYDAPKSGMLIAPSRPRGKPGL
jgi:hypothetical protein